MPFIWSLVISAGFINLLILNFGFSFSLLTIFIHAWIPGLLSLVLARVNKIKIPFLPQNLKYIFTSLTWGIFIGLTVCITTLLLKGQLTSTLDSSHNINNLAFYYGVFLISSLALSLGQEICWRGYFWEKWKRSPLVMGSILWLAWSIWFTPVAISSSTKLLTLFINNLTLMPILYLLREKSGSILSGTLFYCSIFAASSSFKVVFSCPIDSITSYLIQSLLLATSLLFYFFIKKLKNNSIL